MLEFVNISQSEDNASEAMDSLKYTSDGKADQEPCNKRSGRQRAARFNDIVRRINQKKMLTKRKN